MAINEERLRKLLNKICSALETIQYLLDPKLERCRKRSTREYELGMLAKDLESMNTWNVFEDPEEDE